MIINFDPAKLILFWQVKFRATRVKQAMVNFQFYTGYAEEMSQFRP